MERARLDILIGGSHDGERHHLPHDAPPSVQLPALLDDDDPIQDGWEIEIYTRSYLAGPGGLAVEAYVYDSPVQDEKARSEAIWRALINAATKPLAPA